MVILFTLTLLIVTFRLRSMWRPMSVRAKSKTDLIIIFNFSEPYIRNFLWRSHHSRMA